MHYRRVGLLSFVALALALSACARAAELIPGDAGMLQTPTPSDTPEPIATGPILVTPTLQLNTGTGTATASIVPDHELARSVVQVLLLAESDGVSRVVRSGSGVVIDTAQRLILTSYPLVHPVRRDGGRAYTTIAIGTNRNPGSEPGIEFQAEIVAAEPGLDLAVLRAVRTADGAPLRAGTFDLPQVRLATGVSSAVGDPVRLFGHPGPDPGGEPASLAVSVTQASIAGLRGAAGVTGRAWITTDARLSYGGQGGPAFDRNGSLVGLLVQPTYNAAAPVAEFRPLDLGVAMLERARAAGPEARYRAPLMARPASGTNGLGSADGVWVGQPSFAQNAIDRPGGRELFDYRRRFAPGIAALYYEFVAQGVRNGALVEERWYRGDVMQDQLSSSYPWQRGPFGVISDRIITPNPAGLPEGRWRLEVWIDGVLRSSGTAIIGSSTLTPSIEGIGFGAFAGPDGDAAVPPSAQAEQILFFLSYDGMEDAQQIRWLVFRNGQIVYQSPDLPWTGDNSGRWWIGYRANGSLGPGTWEFEVYVDGRVVAVDSRTLP